MDSHAVSIRGLIDDEKATLLDDKSPSELEHDAPRADLTSRFPAARQWTTATTTHAAHRAVTNLPSLLRRTAIFLLPSFIQPLLTKGPSPSPSQPPRPGPTAYLDGLRGLAALAVFFCHYLYTSFTIAPGYGTSHAHHHLPLLPFLRLIFSGPPMVCLFFVVSGYALSLKPLRLIHARDWAGLDQTMASFIFRRGIRLFLPTAVSTAVVVGLVWAGGYEWTREFANDARYLRNVRETHFGRDGMTVGELGWEWAGDMFRFVHVWDWAPFGGSTALDVHLWTVPVEFRCSMGLFLTVLGTGRLRRGWRLGVVGGLVVFVYLSQRWEMVLFYAGMVLAEMDVVRGAHGGLGVVAPALPLPVPGLMSASSSRASSPSPLPARRWTTKRTTWTALSVVGLYLMSQPDERGAETPGWVFLTSLIPKWWEDEHRYWQSVGAILFVFAVGRSRGWQRFFTLPVVQYFGRISYALYLMHGPVMHTVGYAIERWAWGLTGTDGRAYEAGFALATVFVVPIVIWVSDVFWRAVDAPVVRFAKWLEARCSISE